MADLTSFIQRQAPIDRALADSLIAATPESWNSAVMTVERFVNGGIERFSIEITSPEGKRDVISPTKEIIEGVKKLSDLFVGHGRPWQRVLYSVSLKETGEWKFQVDFSYPQ